MRVPFVDLQAQYATIRPEVDQAIADVVASGWFILGKQVEAFERAFSDYLGGGETIGVASGTDALHLALKACDVGPGDEVITASHSFIATALAISQVGARAVFVDSEPGTHTIDATRVEACISPRTKAIVPVHLFGQPADLDPICQIARVHGLAVVEDACQAHGSRYHGRPVGTIGDAGCFSFYPAKNLGAYGDGGAVVTANPKLAARLRMLRNYGQTRKYYHALKGFNSRLDEIQAAVLLAKLPHLEGWNDARRKVAARYNEVLDARVVRPVERLGSRHVYHLYVIRTRRRAELQKWLAERSVETQIHYPVPIHLQEAYLDHGVTQGSLPICERDCEEVLSLPMYPELTERQILHVAECVNAFQDAAA